MKPHSQKKKFRPTKRAPDKSTAEPIVTLSRRQKWLFRLLAAVVMPLILLVGLELILRLGGYGYPTGFFEKIQVDGRKYLINNENFSRRFFPPQLMRWPEPVMLAQIKPADTYRVIILGESAARGEPQPNYAASRYLKVLLEERFPRAHFEMVNLGITAINSHVILPIARDCAAVNADLWIVYLGNNEMVGPFGAATVFGAKSPPLSFVRLNLAIQKTRVGQLLVNLSRKLHGSEVNKSWGGMQMFIGNQLRADDPRKEVVYQNFAQNLDDILRVGTGSGAKILLNTVAVNLKDCPPFAALTNVTLSPSAQVDFDKSLGAAHMAQAQSDWSNAATKYEAAARWDAQFPDLQFQWAQCLLRAGNATAAREHFQKACDADALPFRADSRINAIIAAAAKKRDPDTLRFFDAATALAAQAKDGICGQESFYEHVHFNFDGEFRLGLAWAMQIESMLPSEITSPAATNIWASQESCEARLGLTDWNRGAAAQMMTELMQHPPLSSQFNNPERMALLRTEVATLHSRMDTNEAQLAAALYLKAIDRSPGDPQLHENYAQFLESFGDLKSALAQHKAVLVLLPEHSVCLYNVGRLLEEMDQFETAEPFLRRAVALCPQLAQGWSELGKVHLGMGQNEQALADFLRVVDMDSLIAMNHALVGNALSRLNRHPQAIQYYQQALKIQPNLFAVEFSLGNELATVNQFEEAQKAYVAVIKIRPDHLPARLNLGVILARFGQFDAALEQFQEVLRLDPQNSLAREYQAKVQGLKLRGR